MRWQQVVKCVGWGVGENGLNPLSSPPSQQNDPDWAAPNHSNGTTGAMCSELALGLEPSGLGPIATREQEEEKQFQRGLVT